MSVGTGETVRWLFVEWESIRRARRAPGVRFREAGSQMVVVREVERVLR
jgi:hypothetical protein